MRKEELTQTLVTIYEEKVDGVDVFKVKPWEVQKGMILVFRSTEELELLDKKGFLYGPFTSKLKKKLTTQIVVDDNIVKNIHAHSRMITEIDEQIVTLAMLTRFDEFKLQVEQQHTQPEEQMKHTSIKQSEIDEQIIKEMISKVDKKRFKVLLSIAASLGSNKVIVENDIVDKYLDIWARNKYEFYLLMGRNFTVQKEVTVPMSSEEMGHQLRDLKRKYVKYWPLIEQFPTQFYLTNSLQYVSSTVRDMCPQATDGMKLTKFFNDICEDPKFDVDLSMLLQNKMVKGNITISIDPYDYLTSSINQHGWRSCHRITDGEYATGSISYLLDSATLIACKYNDIEYNYNLNNFKFKGNSKTYRQCIYMDKESCGIIFGRQYPNSNKELAKEFRMMLEKLVADYVGVKDTWIMQTNSVIGQYTDVSSLHYSDVDGGWDFKCVKPKYSLDTPYFTVGSEAPCLCCGEYNVTDSNERCLCEDCY